MPFQSIAGQERIKAMLQKSLRQQLVSHAYLLTGPKGTGKRALAKVFAQALFCLEREDDACGECLECRKIEHGNHPAFRWIRPEGKWLKIDQIRELQRQFAYRSDERGYRVYVLEDADKMQEAAANSLLKFLEEPGTGVVALLLTENERGVYATIRSRTQLLPFVPLDAEAMVAVLVQEGYAPELARLAVRLSSGIENARELVQGNGFAETRNLVIQLAKDCTARPHHAMLLAGQKIGKAAGGVAPVLVIDLFILWLRDMVRLCAGVQEQFVFTDQLAWMETLAYSKGAHHWISGLELAISLQRRLRSNANAQMVMDKLIIGLKGG